MKKQEFKKKIRTSKCRKRKKSIAGMFEESVSTYRIFSRAFCNFVFPRPHIKRPLPSKDDNIEKSILNENADEDILDAVSPEEKKKM